MGKISYGRTIARLAGEDPGRTAVVCGEEAITRAELERRSNRMARAFALRGVGRGSLVSIGLPNGLEFVVVCVAAWKCGAIPNPLSPRLPGPERIAILELAKPALVVGFDDVDCAHPQLASGFEPDAALPDTPLPDVVSPNERVLASGGSTGRPKANPPANLPLVAVPRANPTSVGRPVGVAPWRSLSGSGAAVRARQARARTAGRWTAPEPAGRSRTGRRCCLGTD
jgi:bile acid-coenzyme A ligase